MSCKRLVAQHCDTDWTHSNIQIDAAGSVVRPGWSGRLRHRWKQETAGKKVEQNFLFLLYVELLPSPPCTPSGLPVSFKLPGSSFLAACSGSLSAATALGYATSSEQIGSSNNPLYTISLRSCCCSGSRCCCMHVSSRFLLVSCSCLWACCCLLLISYHSLLPARTCCCRCCRCRCCRFRRLH